MTRISQHVLDSDNHARQRSGRARSQFGIDRRRLDTGLLCPYFQKSIKLCVLLLNVIQVVINELNAGSTSGQSRLNIGERGKTLHRNGG